MAFTPLRAGNATQIEPILAFFDGIFKFYKGYNIACG